MYHISIYFDTKTQVRMLNCIKKVADATGNRYMLEADVPPHITLAAFACAQEEKLIKRLEALVSGMQSDALQWVSVGTFLPGVIFLQPVLSEYLQGLVQQVHECLQEVEGVKIHPYYRPFSWLPHSTVAKKLTQAQLQQAFEVLSKEFAVFEGKVVRIGLAKMNPHRELASWELSSVQQDKEKDGHSLRGRLC